MMTTRPLTKTWSCGCVFLKKVFIGFPFQPCWSSEWQDNIKDETGVTLRCLQSRSRWKESRKTPWARCYPMEQDELPENQAVSKTKATGGPKMRFSCIFPQISRRQFSCLGLICLRFEQTPLCRSWNLGIWEIELKKEMAFFFESGYHQSQMLPLVEVQACHVQ